jgi:precorrin-6B methylase 1
MSYRIPWHWNSIDSKQTKNEKKKKRKEKPQLKELSKKRLKNTSMVLKDGDPQFLAEYYSD